jgi:mRNA interferase MazF
MNGQAQKMKKLMEIYDKFVVVKVHFPFTDVNSLKIRPALVISGADYQRHNHHCVLSMITSAKHSLWIDDINISNIALAGLSTMSKIRFKIFSLSEDLIISKIGRLGAEDISLIQKVIGKYL